MLKKTNKQKNPNKTKKQQLIVSDLVKKADFNAKWSNAEPKYFTSSNYNKLMGQIPVQRWKKD